MLRNYQQCCLCSIWSDLICFLVFFHGWKAWMTNSVTVKWFESHLSYWKTNIICSHCICVVNLSNPIRDDYILHISKYNLCNIKPPEPLTVEDHHCKAYFAHYIVQKHYYTAHQTKYNNNNNLYTRVTGKKSHFCVAAYKHNFSISSYSVFKKTEYTNIWFIRKCIILGGGYNLLLWYR